MTICLITPPSLFLLDARVFPSLGILRVASSLEQGGYTVEHLDLNAIDNYLDVVRIHAQKSQANVFGLTATTPQMPATAKVLRAIREVKPDAKVILGGPHVTLVNAGRKKDEKLGRQGRAVKALHELSEQYDTLVAGDGEDAIYHALMDDAPKLVDADDAASALFLTNQRYDELPLPARHLLDMSSYHYTIDGAQSTSLIGQLGCLAAGTLVTLSDERQIPIEHVREGDSVVCFDERNRRMVSAPVAKTFEREAKDLWEVTANNSTPLLVTGEHPVWTPNGWKTVDSLVVGDFLAVMPELSVGPQSGAKEVLQLCVSGGMAEDERQSGMAESRSASNEDKVAGDDAGGAGSVFEHRISQSRRCDPALPETHIRVKARRPKPDEATRSSAESLRHDEGEVDAVPVGEAKEGMGRWEDAPSFRGPSGGRITEQAGIGVGGHSNGRGPRVSVCREQGILDRTLHFGQATESRLHRQGTEESYSRPRRVLAFAGINSGGYSGLPVEGLASASDLDEGTANPQEERAPEPPPRLRFQRVTSKRFLGRSKVYNITVCPGHSYLANSILVHNCPYKCTFCGGRNSPMLRRIRSRSVEKVVDELRYLHQTYGYTGWMHYDDELNVSKSMIPFMDAMAELQREFGVTFQQRGFIKSNLFNDEQAAAMKRAGFKWILIGFESGSPRILENIQKQATREQNSECMAIARRHGLKVKALMSIGHAGETEETIRETHEWLLEEKPADFDATVITTYPGCPYYDDAVETSEGVWTYAAPKTGDRLHAIDIDFNETEDFYKGKMEDYHSYVYTDHLTADEIVTFRDKLERDVRARLDIPFNASQPGIRFEASMGQLPGHILRKSSADSVLA